MTIYRVGVREVHVSTREIDAESPEEALDKVQEDEGEEVMCEYSHTLDRDVWTVEKIEPPLMETLMKLRGVEEPLTTEELDELVHDYKGHEASAINNSGHDEQVQYILESMGETVHKTS
jgi:predicted transcriptional regulator YheO